MFKFFERQTNQYDSAKIVHPSGFGKIPHYNEFFRHNVRQREVVAFEHWLQEGVGCIARRYPKNTPDFFRTFPCHHFVRTGSDQEHNLFGSLVGSQDKSGRVYPFALMYLNNNQVFASHRAAVAVTYAKRFLLTEGILETLADHRTSQELANRLELLAYQDDMQETRTILSEQIRLLRDIPSALYWDRLAAPMTDELKERFLFTFFDFLKTVIKRGPSKCVWGIRIPLPNCKDPTPFVVFWVQMIEAILEDRFWRAHYFWNKSSAEYTSSLTLFFRELPPSHLLPLINHKCKDNVIYDVLDETYEIPNFVSRIDRKRLLLEADTSLLDLLYRLGRREIVL